MGSVVSSVLGGGAPKVSAPKVNIKKDINQYVEGYTGALPNVLSAEQKYRPQFLGLNLGDAQNFLQGYGGQQGVMGLSALAQQGAGQNINAARGQDFASMMGNAGGFRGFAQALSPESQLQVDAANQEAARAQQSARNLNPQEARIAEQGARESFAARGRLNDNSSIAGEVMNRESMLGQKRQEANMAGQNAFNMAQNFYSAPGQQFMSQAPMSYQAGQQQLGFGLNAIGSATPQMINPDTGVNIGMQQRSQQLQAQMANAQSAASQSSGIMGALGTIGGSIIGGPIGGMIGKAIFSK